MKKDFYWTLVYLAALVLLSVFRSFSNLTETSLWLIFAKESILFILGGLVGFYFVFFEKLWQIVYLNPKAQTSIWVKQYLKKRQFKDLKSFAVYVYQTDFSANGRSIINSFLFHLSWVVITIFTLTSTNVYFGRGLLMGLGFYIVLGSWRTYQQSRERFCKETFWQIARPITARESQYYLYIFIGVFALISIFLL